MIIVNNVLVDPLLLKKDTYFTCNLKLCKGACCVFGDAGAPLELNEIDIIKEYLDEIKPFMQKKLAKLITAENFFEIDPTGDFVTALNNNKECVFVFFENQVAYCAIERSFLFKKIPFRKPLSCHLYPIRVEKNNYFKKIYYHCWDICNRSQTIGNQNKFHILDFLKDALIRGFGKSWYSILYKRLSGNNL